MESKLGHTPKAFSLCSDASLDTREENVGIQIAIVMQVVIQADIS